jgi:hypothetical protein
MKTVFEIPKKAWRTIVTGDEQDHITGLLEKLQDTMTETGRELHLLAGEFREHRGEFREFKGHVLGRVEKLETKETEQAKKTLTVLSLFISGAALAVSIAVNFFKNGGK